MENAMNHVKEGAVDDAVGDITAAVNGMGQLGVLRMLGLRLTIGTMTAVGEKHLWPPSVPALLGSFNTLYLKSKLSVGGKALAKHTVRHESWWGGDLKGTETAKSQQAEAIVTKILDNATWINLHMLPHGKPTFEIRVPEGYGARWAFDTDTSEYAFRGFLEPQQEDGHANRWRH
eukprot:TRINITY_DN44495_c0_g1_i1.p1 TRINITY_DN44495_c0_g1~~TRINITY_DN44495_c0_g1_i1.p1  ORF type:complete len:175 (+),score=16.91 TRINITY_DN44495_c0_g1_i1:33-557(+)